MTIEVRQLLIRSRVGSHETDEAVEKGGGDKASSACEQSAAEESIEVLQDELEQWRRRMTDAVRLPRER